MRGVWGGSWELSVGHVRFVSLYLCVSLKFRREFKARCNPGSHEVIGGIQAVRLSEAPTGVGVDRGRNRCRQRALRPYRFLALHGPG